MEDLTSSTQSRQEVLSAMEAIEAEKKSLDSKLRELEKDREFLAQAEAYFAERQQEYKDEA